MIPQYYEFFNGIKILSGNQALVKMPDELIMRGKTCPLVIFQKELIDRSTQKLLLKVIEDKGLKAKHIFHCTNSSDDACVTEAISEFESSKCDSVIAVGDSPVFELGQIIKSRQDQKQEEQHVNKITFASVPVTVTGMEILGDPDIIVLDPGLTLNLSMRETVLSVIDTICHSIEAYTSSKKNPVSDAYSFSAIKLAAEGLPAIIRKARDRKARHALLNGAILSGMGFLNSGGGISHTIAKGITECCKVSHTEAVSIILPYCLEYNMLKNDEYYGELLLPLKGPDIYSETPLYERGRRFHNYVRDMIFEYQKKWNIPTCLSQVGVKRSDFDRITSLSLNTEDDDTREVQNILNLAF